MVDDAFVAVPISSRLTLGLVLAAHCWLLTAGRWLLAPSWSETKPCGRQHGAMDALLLL